ncbi:hypothetical protein BDFB_011934 [Asbolus verrucosus]|uniref:Uncharacterized protein n=1 Tax=Asbolus verrucosus TaxID=1661398 RepID=A0A482VRB8_ASBVE|nr:hypothetical protein BDFB_011934 [Asbolus verrucosus]
MRVTGYLTPSHRDAGRPRTKRTPALEKAMLEEMGEYPDISTYNLALHLHLYS